MLDNIKNKFLKKINFYIQRLDLPFLISLLFIIAIGIIAVMSTSFSVAGRTNQNYYIYIKKMLFYIPFGLSVLIIIQYFKPKQIRNISIIGFIILTILLFLTLLNPSVKGAQRWINLGFFKIQPSEFLKPVFAIVIAIILAKIKRYKENNFIDLLKNKPARNYIILLLGILITTLFVFKLQKDYSMFLIYACIFGAELLLTGINLKYITGLVIVGIMSIFIIAKVPHVAKRIDSFRNGSFQGVKSKNAIENSNLFFGGHDNNLKKYIPDVHTDFIFTGIIEETSGIVAISIIFVFLFLLLHLFMKIYKKTDEFTIYSSVGILTYFTYQIVIHIASNLGLIPIDGITLPFMSYGGSSFISSCIGIGILLSLLRNSV